LGALESGVDIERRIAQVYQTCRNTEEIRTAFDRLQAELDEQIQVRMAQTREVLLENFDEDVSARLRVNRDKTLETLSNRERNLLELTRTELKGEANFETERPRFLYSGTFAQQGWYNLDWKAAEKNGDTFYRQDHPLATQIIEQALSRNLPPAAVTLDYAAHHQVISVLKPLLGTSGWLELAKLTVESLDTEEFLIFAARADSGQKLDEEMCRKLFLLPAKMETLQSGSMPDLSSILQTEIQGKLKQVEERNMKFFDEEVLKLDRWSDDLKQGLEREIKELDRQIREARKTSALAGLLRDKLETQKTLKSLEGERNRKRRELFDAQDAIDGQRDELIKRIEGQLRQRHAAKPVFSFRWRLA
jgi:adenine-specific DNA-methyltransferase